MRAGFLFAILLASLYYTYVAFVDLNFLSSAGRLGPGFFPRLIGILLIVVTLSGLWADWRRSAEDDTSSPYWGVLGVVVLFSGLFVLLLNILGGTLAMMGFLFATLSVLNPRRLVQNLAIAIVLPLGIYFLFDVWLNASMPEGLIELPI